jgi:hypothetical protein
MLPVAPMGPAAPVPIPGIPIPARSITIALVMVDHPPHVDLVFLDSERTSECLFRGFGPYYRNDRSDFNIKLQGYFELSAAILSNPVRIK